MRQRISPVPSRNEMTDRERGGVPTRPWDAFLNAIRDAANRAGVQIGVASVLSRNSAIATTPIPTEPLLPGLFRVSYVVRVSTPAAGTSSVQVTIGWTAGGVAQSQTGAALTGNTTSTKETASFLIRIDAGTPVTYAVSYASNPAGQMRYDFDAHLEDIPG